MKRIGSIDGRRLAVGGVAGWSGVPGLLIPGQLQVFGIFEECLHVSELNVPAGIGHMPPGWKADVGAAATLVTGDELGGLWLLQTDGDDNDWIQLTLGSLNGGAFWPQINKEIWFEARIKASPADDIILAVGLQDPSAAVYMGNANAGPAVNNHLLFNLVDENDGEAQNWYFEGDKAGTADPNDLSVAHADLTFVTLGFHVHGHDTTGLLPGQVDVYVNRALVAAGKVLTASIPITGLMPCVCLKAGQAETQALYVDYIMCVQQR